MTRAYASIAFTPDVLAAQHRWGSRERCAVALRSDIEPQDVLTPAAAAFAAQVNSAFIATLSSGGWPYVQHRGGMRGFIRVLDERRLLFPDFEGNGQMLTVGNLAGNPRTMLLLIDYEQRRRLKLWGQTRVLAAIDPSWHVQASAQEQGASRWLLFTVQAMNFNCSAFIPRWVAASCGAPAEG